MVGQLLDAIKSGKYDINKTALIMSQTGGGCRASNYIYLLRKALKKNNLENIPVISFNMNGMEKNPGFKLTLGMMVQFVYAMLYGDILMLLNNQTRPYEIHAGDKLSKELSGRSILNNNKVKRNLERIASDFAAVPKQISEKIKVGIVGEIYMKYSPLGNNNLEEFLLQEGAEVEVPGLLDFVLYCCNNGAIDARLYGIRKAANAFTALLKGYLLKMQSVLIQAVKAQKCFRAPSPFNHIKSLIHNYVGLGNKMGEGWLLTAEMLDLITSGISNIVCTQPFGCLPNHIVGKGMIRKIKENYPQSNIVAIDYDPSATRINQENRIKLMLSTAKLNLIRQT